MDRMLLPTDQIRHQVRSCYPIGRTCECSGLPFRASMQAGGKPWLDLARPLTPSA